MELRIQNVSRTSPNGVHPNGVHGVRDVEAEPMGAVAGLRGRIWRRITSKEKLPALEREQAVISTRLLAGRTVAHVDRDTTRCAGTV